MAWTSIMNNNIGIIIALNASYIVFVRYVKMDVEPLKEMFYLKCGTILGAKNHLLYCSDTHPRLWGKLILPLSEKLHTPRKRTKLWFWIFSDLPTVFRPFKSILMLLTECLLQGPSAPPTNLFIVKHHKKAPRSSLCLHSFPVCAVGTPRASSLIMTWGYCSGNTQSTPRSTSLTSLLPTQNFSTSNLLHITFHPPKQPPSW